MTKYYVYHVSYVYKKRMLFWSKYCFGYEVFRKAPNVLSDYLVANYQAVLEAKTKTKDVSILNIIKLEE